MSLFSFIHEAPTFIPSSPTEAWDSSDYLSHNNVSKFYNDVTSIVTNGVGVYILQHKHNQLIFIGVIKAAMPWDENEKGYKIIFSLTFKQPSIELPDNIQHKKTIQVKNVATDINFAGRGLASFVYFTLADNGYVILSDNNHLFGGIKFWRKMSRLAARSNGEFTVNIIKNSKYLTDKSGNIISFNDKNYPKSKIWSTLPDVRNRNVTLVLQKNDNKNI